RVLVLQWWTATVLHTYLVLAAAGRLLGARVVVELHELQDPGEEHLALARWYGRWGLRLLLRLAHGCVVHSAADSHVLRARFGPLRARLAVAPHGPFDQYRPDPARPARRVPALAAVRAAPRPAVTNLLFFGTIR